MEWHVLPSGRRIVICVRRNGMNKIEEIQAELRDRQIPAWLFYDHHHRDAISYRILGLPEPLMVSRRWFYLIPAEGEPVKLGTDSSLTTSIQCPVTNRFMRPGSHSWISRADCFPACRRLPCSSLRTA